MSGNGSTETKFQSGGNVLPADAGALSGSAPSKFESKLVGGKKGKKGAKTMKGGNCSSCKITGGSALAPATIEQGGLKNTIPSTTGGQLGGKKRKTSKRKSSRRKSKKTKRFWFF